VIGPARSRWVCLPAADGGKDAPLVPTQYISRPGACGKTRVVVQSFHTKPKRSQEEWLHMTEHAVVVGGGGPTRMMLAAELALAKVDVELSDGE
jgi:NADPH-dependent 2,4-dienoyl-CoA reductase/sulfur reductase-like enzyme